MAQLSRKIINDPVYGFITLDHPLLLSIVAHPYYQRLRRIQQVERRVIAITLRIHRCLHKHCPAPIRRELRIANPNEAEDVFLGDVSLLRN